MYRVLPLALLFSCVPQDDMPVDGVFEDGDALSAPPPLHYQLGAPLSLSADASTVGSVTLTVVGAAPNQEIRIGGSYAPGFGTFCPLWLNSQCAALATVGRIQAGFADSDGNYSATIAPPASYAGSGDVWLQAFSVRDLGNRVLPQVSNVVQLLSDADMDGVADIDDPCPDDPGDDVDGDGVCDSDDVCDGDDNVGDADGDGLCDDTDPCPADNPDDIDGDGACDSDDPCPDDPADACATPNGKIVFMTRDINLGNFGGVTGGDAVCQTAAVAGGLTGTFKAWLSSASSSSGPATRFIRSTSEPYVLRDGTIVADNWSDLTDGTIDNGITIDEYGDPVSGSVIFSFTRTDGTPGLFGSASSNCYGDDCHCNNWTTAATSGSPTPGSAVARSGFTNDDWTDYSFGNFCNRGRLLCFEQ